MLKKEHIDDENLLNDVKDISDKKKYTLTRGCIKCVFIYYFILIILGLIVSSHIIVKVATEKTGNIILDTVSIALAMSAMLSGVKYTKVLYIACIRDQIDEKRNFNREIGNLVYFVFRPLYAMVFAVVSIVAILGGFFGITGNLDYFVNERFVYLVAIISCVIGISAGNVLDKFNELSRNKINKL